MDAAAIDLSLEQIKDLCLDLDRARNRLWQLYANNQLVLQENGTNPKITQLDLDAIAQIPDLIDKQIVYEARIIKNPNLKPLIGAHIEYALSFDEGKTKQIFQLTKIAESKIQDFSWLLILAK